MPREVGEHRKWAMSAHQSGRSPATRRTCCSTTLLEKIAPRVRLSHSKGVGVFFATQTGATSPAPCSFNSATGSGMRCTKIFAAVQTTASSPARPAKTAASRDGRTVGSAIICGVLGSILKK